MFLTSFQEKVKRPEETEKR